MKKILIVDDAAFMRLAIRTILERNGFEVVGEAEDGLDAITKYQILKPDIVTMDITMPKMDGIDATAEIKKIDKDATIIIISAIGQETMVRRAILAGAKTFVVKPFKEEHVIKTLNKF